MVNRLVLTSLMAICCYYKTSKNSNVRYWVWGFDKAAVSIISSSKRLFGEEEQTAMKDIESDFGGSMYFLYTYIIASFVLQKVVDWYYLLVCYFMTA
jgi:hypothetical protein